MSVPAGLLRIFFAGLILSSLAKARATEPASGSDTAERRLAAIEKSLDGRLGVAALDSGNGRRLEHRANERFPMCSTFKVLAVAAVLRRVDEKQDDLTRFIPYTAADLLEYAPVTTEQVKEGGMTLGTLCAAALELSDNTAANLLLKTIGGPEGLTRYARSLGDQQTRLDRIEPYLNSAIPGDERDTTTPAAMLANLRTLFLAMPCHRHRAHSSAPGSTQTRPELKCSGLAFQGTGGSATKPVAAPTARPTTSPSYARRAKHRSSRSYIALTRASRPPAGSRPLLRSPASSWRPSSKQLVLELRW